MENGQFAAALEITPPRRELPHVLLRRARLLGESVQAINVIQRPGRQSSLEASIALRAEGLNPAWHIVNRGRTRAELASELERAHKAGIRQLLCIRGDHDAEDNAKTPKLWELVAMARERMPGAAIGATLNHYAPRLDGVFRNLGPKIEAGASYVQTQPVFDLEHLRPAAETLRGRFPGVRLVAMAMPLLDAGDAGRIGKRLGFVLPEDIVRRIEGGPESAWQLFEENMAALGESKLVDGVAIMTFEMDPSQEMAARIVRALAAAGAYDPSTQDGEPGTGNER
jgi:methylenetetrahydrofolate reductase (NADPH)